MVRQPRLIRPGAPPVSSTLLAELRVRNYALIQELVLQFAPGLNVLTGETGAGKSIIIGALSALLGGKPDPEMIRSGADCANVEARFTHPECVTAVCEQLGIDCGSELVIRRRLERGGRGSIHVNDSTLTVAGLEQLGDRLVDLHGQHQHQLLLRPQVHLETLDAYAGIVAERREFALRFDEYKRESDKLERLQRELADRRQRRDLTEFQYRELTDASVIPGESETLREEQRLLQTTERRYVLVRQIEEMLSEKDESILSSLSAVEKVLGELSRLDQTLAPRLGVVAECRAMLDDLWRELVRYRETLEFSPERNERINVRLFLIEKLARKYQVPASELPGLVEKLRVELESLELDESRVDELKREVARRREELLRLASRLTHKRHRARLQMERALSAEFAALALDGSKLETRITTGDSLAPHGADDAEFLFSANPGEPLKPLRKVVSGGELSRIMLALKGVLAGLDPIPVLVFDEIDVGIGGRIAENVGRRLARLGRTHQVICITHLPQIAKYANAHFLVFKKTSAGRTSTLVRRLDDTERVVELARMTSGTDITKSGLAHAREMLDTAERDRDDETGSLVKKRK